VDFTLRHAPTERKRMIETMAGGLAVFDFDGDGLQDIYFTNGAAGESMRKESPGYSNRLFRNLGGMRFEDVTEAAGVAGSGYSMGAAAADFDNDGHVDLFVAGVFQNTLFRNLGDDTFEDITARSGISSGEWSVAAGWFHYDDDGRADLFVVNYADWTPDFDRYCGDRDRGLRVYCHPKYLTPIANRLYRNLGSGKFEPIGERLGLSEFEGRGMSATFADFDANGRVDVFVTNDKLPNFLFSNTGQGRFEETAFEATIALPEHGRDVSGMGLDARDIDGDGLAEVVYAALPGETFPLMRNTPEGYFVDITGASGIAGQTRDMAGYSAIIADFDNDARKDIFFSRGDVQVHPIHQGVQIRQHNSVFRNVGERGYVALTEEAGFDAAPPRRHRGAVVGDLNGDGRLDLAVTALGDPAEIWINDSEPAAGWLAVDLEGTSSNRDGIGAVVRVETPDGTQFNHVTTSVGYASSSAGPVHFGLGSAPEVERVTVEWPSGVTTTIRGVAANQVLRVREEPGEAPDGD